MKINSMLVATFVLFAATGCGGSKDSTKAVASRTAFKSITGTQTQDGAHGPNRAFDGSVAADDFWEASLNPQAELDIDYGAPIVVGGYEFSAGESSNRMPTAWKLLASSDLSTWKTLDTRSNVSGWEANKSLRFDAHNTNPYQYYRLVFEKALEPGIVRIYEIKLVNSPAQMKN